MTTQGYQRNGNSYSKSPARDEFQRMQEEAARAWAMAQNDRIERGLRYVRSRLAGIADSVDALNSYWSDQNYHRKEVERLTGLLDSLAARASQREATTTYSNGHR
jgi:hypothetical protein